MRLNVWRYDTGTGKTEQITKMADFDIVFMSAGPSDIVFECGGRLYLMDLKTHQPKPVDVQGRLGPVRRDPSPGRRLPPGQRHGSFAPG